MTTGDSDGLHELEVIVNQELVMIDSRDIEEELAEPQSEWLYDPTDAQRDGVELRNLLGAIEAVEQGTRAAEPDHEPQATTNEGD
jgi:hypothetical protein